MTTKRESSTASSQQVHYNESENREPPSYQVTSSISPNRRQQTSSPPPRISTSSSMLSDSESPGSYTSYSSADYSSSASGAMNHEIDNINSNANNSKKRVLLKSIQTNMQSTNSRADIDFSHGLLSQVHKMQSLLEEYQHSLTALEIEKADNQQEINKLDKRLKGKGETEERYKEEIWNLELKNQELLQKIDDLSQSFTKSKLEQTRLARTESALIQEIENLKAIQHTWEQQLQEAQENHEMEILHLKKLLHTSKVENDSLSKQIQELVSQHATAMATTASLRPVIADSIEESNDKENENMEVNQVILSQSLNEVSLDNANNNNINITTEANTLKKSLEQAHEIIQTMQEKIDKERKERVEVDKLLREAQETIENYNNLNSPNASCQWYPVQSPTLSAHSNECPDSNLLSPTFSMNSSDNNYQHHSRQHSRKSTAGICSGKSCRRRFVALSKSPFLGRGKSLCDELSQAGSTGNFASSITDLTSPVQIKVISEDDDPNDHQNESTSLSMLFVQKEDGNSSPVFVANDQQGINRIDNETGILGKRDHIHSVQQETTTIKLQVNDNEAEILNESSMIDRLYAQETSFVAAALPKTVVELSYEDLPSISNHDMYLSFSSKSSSDNTAEEEDNDNEEIKVVVQQNNEHYGSLLRKPESYIYKSRRELAEEKRKGLKKTSNPALMIDTMTESSFYSKAKVSGKSNKRRDSVDDKSVSALTRAMIGDWMWKYTRKVVGNGISENKHRRFFWIHPYTQTLYWSSKEPGSDGRESNTKSVLVESFVILDDDNKNENSVFPPSILVKTPSRALKIQCMNIVAHQAWIKCLKFLLEDSKKNNEIAPKLSNLGNVSKQHYLNRKKSVFEQITTATADDDSKANQSYEDVMEFKFERPVVVAIDELMPPPSPAVFTL